MQKNYLGEFEELVLLTVATMNGDGYGAVILDDITKRTSRAIQLSAIHVALYRLEDKGLVRSHMGGATQERGGRRKRFYSITSPGIRMLAEIRRLREELWSLIPKLN
ncbi:MAG: PadR family transcriptional regulator [Chitinophagaceae bacterium]|nr:MAG: PadR family transcriptional regulator [Chitinophagaceae bacterium]